MRFTSARAVITTLIDSRAAGDIENFLGCYEREPAIVAQPGQIQTGLAAARQALARFTALYRTQPPGERPMKTAEELLLQFTATFRDVEKAAALFAEDAAFELPYLSSLGIPARYLGREEIKGFLHTVLELYPDWEFKPEDVNILIATPEQAFAEYVTRPTAAATGRKIEHLFMGRLVAENGEIKLLREALNTVAAAQALLPGGLGEIPMPEGPIRSY